MMKYSSPRRRARNGFGLVEVIVCVGCLAVLAMIFLPWLLSSRGHSRDQLCLMRCEAVTKAVILYAENNANVLPYLVEEAGWPVTISPFLNLPGAMRDEKLVPEEELKTLAISQFLCPEDPRAQEQLRASSFVLNGGYGLFPVDAQTGAVSETGTHSAGIDLDGDGEVSAEEWGINYATGACWRPDARPPAEAFRMSLPWISNGDGMEFTLLLSENLNAQEWLSKETMDLAFVIGRENLSFAKGPESQGPLHLLSAELGPFAINADLGTLPGRCPAPSSLHGDYVHAMYCDGHGGPLSSKIDPLAYARLMTSNGSKYGQAGSEPVAGLEPK